ncbi:MAG: hypothetical protein K2M37_07160 [Muribaculaceae bacterium]|nr:hypothetical protein [Muribaculaceae bacterium]
MKLLNTFSGTLKRILMIIMLAISAGSWNFSFADNGDHKWDPILQTGRKWIYKHWIRGMPDSYPFTTYTTVEITGDSIMPDGRMVKVAICNDKVLAVGYENKEGIFMKPEPIEGEPQEFRKVISFEVNVGDKFYTGEVISIENVTFLNHTRKVIFFNFNNNCWIEGIGSPTEVFMEPGMGPVLTGEMTILEEISTLIECWQDDELIYTMEAFNAANSMKELTDVSQTNEGPVYDLFGREIADPQPGSVYIRNGRKFVQQ